MTKGSVAPDYSTRVVDRDLDELLPALPAIALEGPKGVGKTATAQRRAQTVIRLDDPADGAVMRLQIIHDGERLEGSYVLFQPFCGIDLPPASAGAEICEFDGVSADVTWQVNRRRATIVFRPGSDGASHRLVVPSRPRNGRLDGRYFAPGETVGAPVRLSRPPK